MPPLLPAGIGCWTCRARRKKCDGLTPYCDTCERLGLDCAGFAGGRPPWMDGGDLQRDYCKELTNLIKTNRRRGSSTAGLSQNIDLDITMPEFDDPGLWSGTAGMPSPGSAEDLNFWATAYSMDSALSPSSGGANGYFPGDAMTGNKLGGFGNLDLNGTSDPFFNPHGIPAGFTMPPSSSISSGLTSDDSSDGASSHKSGERTDWTLIMQYFDEHFQHLFSMLRGKTSGNEDIKAWLLARLSKSKMLRLVVMSVVLGLGLDLTSPGGLAKSGTHDWGQFQEVYATAVALLEADCKTVLDKHTSSSTRRKLGLSCTAALIHTLIIENSISTLEPPRGHCRHLASRVLKVVKVDRDAKKGSSHEMDRSEKNLVDMLAKMLNK